MTEHREAVMNAVRRLDEGDGVAAIAVYDEVEEAGITDIRNTVATLVQMGRLFRDPTNNRVRAYEDYEFEAKFK